MHAEVILRRQGKIVVISRWKTTNAGRKRTGQALEFAAHHLDSVLDLLRDLQRALNPQEPNLDQPENAANEVAHCDILRPFDGYGSNGNCDCETTCRGEEKTSALGPPFEVIREKAGDQPSGSRVGLRRYSFACGVEKLARSGRTFAVDGAAWDSDPLLLGTPKRRRGGGRHRSLTPEQIEEGIGILRNQPKMTIEAARATLRDVGINGSRSALYRLVIGPAYASGS
jgi:hypothetical protein